MTHQTVTVPVEPTEAMIEAMDQAVFTHGNVVEAYRAMIAASPPATAAPEGVVSCQICGGEVQGWTCQDCERSFTENAAGRLVLAALPQETEGWRDIESAAVGEWVLAHDGETVEKVRFANDRSAWIGDWEYSFQAKGWSPLPTLPSPPVVSKEG